MIEVDIGFRMGVACMVYVVPVNGYTAFRCDGMDEVVRMKIPHDLKVIGLTKYGLHCAIKEKEPNDG